MPRYSYFCTQCEEEKILTHGWKEKVEVCIDCGTDSLEKNIPKLRYKSSTSLHPKKHAVGSVVKKAIQDAKDELREDKTEREKKR